MKRLIAILLSLATPSWGAVAHVQSSPTGTATATNPCQIAYPGNVTAGNLLVGYCYSGTAGATLTATDSLGQTWSEAQSQNQATDGHTMKIVYFANSLGGANTLTCNWVGTATFRCGVSEYSGVATTTPLDQHTSAEGNASATANSGNVTPAQDNELIIQAASSGSGTTFTIGTGTQRVNVPDTINTRIGGGEEIQTTATTRQSSWTLGASISWTSLIATFKAAGGAAATVNPASFMNIQGGRLSIQGGMVTIR